MKGCSFCIYLQIWRSSAADCTHIAAHCAAINNLYCNNSNQLLICTDIYACVLQVLYVKLLSILKYHCAALRRIAPHCAALRRIAPHCAALRRIAPHCAALRRIAPHCAALRRIAPHCAALRRIAPHCAALRRIAPHCAAMKQICAAMRRSAAIIQGASRMIS